MECRVGDWVWSKHHGETGQVVAVEELWGLRTLRLWLATSDAIVRVTAETVSAVGDRPPPNELDLVFTAGVLIHVALPDLPRALDEIHRAARRWVLAIEYFADTETSIPYRGRDDLLWKRDFRDHYRRRFADLALVGEGYLDAASGFDRCHWWLFEKPGAGA